MIKDSAQKRLKHVNSAISSRGVCFALVGPRTIKRPKEDLQEAGSGDTVRRYDGITYLGTLLKTRHTYFGYWLK